ncbi:PLD nuclease N-terminal domain-containing protein [Micrococcus luteus]
MAGALTGAAAATPLVPTPGEAALGWTVSVVAGALWVAGFVSLGRSPLDARARLPWVGLMLLLPVLGALIWFWWRHRYYPARRREQPAWDPNDRSAVVVPPAPALRRAGGMSRAQSLTTMRSSTTAAS